MSDRTDARGWKAVLLASTFLACKPDYDPAKRLRHVFELEVDVNRAYVDIDINDRPTFHFPPLDERSPGEYISTDEKIRLTPWIEDGANHIQFHLTPNDDSGLQYSELKVLHESLPDRTLTKIYHSEFEKSGTLDARFDFAPPGAPTCDREVSPEDRREIIENTQALREAVVRRDVDALKASIEGDVPFSSVVEWFLENAWEETRGGEVLVTEIPVEDLRIVRSCANDAFFVTNAKGGEIFRYHFTASSGRRSVQNSIESRAMRKIDGVWKEIH